MIKKANKISIIGGSGTGKTTLSNNLGNELKIPVYHIDGIQYLENWQEKDKKERDQIILEKVKESKWIIDGTYRSTLTQRLENADFIIYLDYTSIAQVKGVLGRFFKTHGKERPDIPGCKERMTLEFLLIVWNWRKNKRKEIMQKINQIDKSKVLIFQNRKQLNKWYKKEFNKKIITDL